MNRIRKIYDRITRDRWEIGFVEGGLAAVMGEDPLQIHWLKHGFKDRWFADPFILDVTDDEILVLVEEYRYNCPKGRIALLTVDKTTYALKSLDIVLELETHLSFPAVWREDGRIFVYPESWLSGALSAYELRGKHCDPDSKTVLCVESMADAIITERFWERLLFSVRENDKLRIYHYNEVTSRFELSIEMQFDEATARNAGDFFEFKGKVFRPAQVCVERYGEAIELQEVLRDDEGLFRFIPLKRLYSTHPFLKTGMHTLNSFKDVVVVDVHGWNNPSVMKLIKGVKKIL